MRLLCASPCTLLLLLISTHGSDAQPAEITDLDLTNFDTYLAEHETVLVHFWAPCAHDHTLIPAPFPSRRLRFPWCREQEVRRLQAPDGEDRGRF